MWPTYDHHPVGCLLGSVIALETAERNGGLFRRLPGRASVGAGRRGRWTTSSSSDVAYDVTFGMPTSVGTPGDVPRPPRFETEGVADPSAQPGDAANFGRFEFIRLVAGIPGSGSNPRPGTSPAT